MYSRMQAFAFPREDGASLSDLTSARASIICGRDSPIVERLPACSQVRRDIGVEALSMSIAHQQTENVSVTDESSQSYHRIGP